MCLSGLFFLNIYFKGVKLPHSKLHGVKSLMRADFIVSTWFDNSLTYCITFSFKMSHTELDLHNIDAVSLVNCQVEMMDIKCLFLMCMFLRNWLKRAQKMRDSYWHCVWKLSHFWEKVKSHLMQKNITCNCLCSTAYNFKIICWKSLSLSAMHQLQNPYELSFYLFKWLRIVSGQSILSFGKWGQRLKSRISCFARYWLLTGYRYNL